MVVAVRRGIAQLMPKSILYHLVDRGVIAVSRRIARKEYLQGVSVYNVILDDRAFLSGVNVAIVNATTGYTVDWIPNISAKTRFTYTPSNYAGNTFRIMISTEDSQGGEAELSAYVY